jgi:hypothetical protein
MPSEDSVVADNSGSGRSVALGDFDGDGDIDIYLANNNGVNKLFLNGPSYKSEWLFVRPLDASGHYTFHGATVRLLERSTGTLLGLRTIDGGSGYGSQNAYDAHFAFFSDAM